MLSLNRYRMLDLSRMVPGPYTSHVLADLGMEVIKVEEPLPRYGMGRDGMTPGDLTPQEELRYAAFNGIARNKKSIALNLLDTAIRPKPQEVFYRLAKEADVVLEGYRPGALKWMGVDYETVKAHNPRIIYCSLTGFGQDGPYHKFPGHGTQFDALSGTILLDSEGNPIPHPVPLGDLSGALYATTSIVGALLHRELTGEGQHIDVPLSGTAMSLMVGAASQLARDGERQREGRRGERASLAYLKCKDGKLLTTSNSETIFWENFCKVLGRPDWIPLYRKQGPESDRMVREVQEMFLTKTRAEWLEILSKAETCVAPVNTIGEAMEDPQMRHLGMVWEMKHPVVGNVRQLGFPVRYSGEKVPPGNFAPFLGQHTREILDRAGYSADEIVGFEKSGVVKSWQGA